MLNISNCCEGISRAIDNNYKPIAKAEASVRYSKSISNSIKNKNTISLKDNILKKIFKVLKNNGINFPSWLQSVSGQPHTTAHLSPHFRPQVFDQSV